MEILKHSSCNDELGVSDQQAEEGVVPLPITRGYSDGYKIVQSFWKPSKEELDALNAGHPVLLEVYGHTHAPLRVMVAAEKD
jgi:hypothetical protein